MKTGLGLNFLRIVNEEGSNGWAQVYARVPFDDFELKEKGALFGVITGEKSDDWADVMAEIMTFVDEYFNKVETGGELIRLIEELRAKYPETGGSWAWVVVDALNNRVTKISHWGNTGLKLNRKEEIFDFCSFDEGRVVKGSVEDGDRLTLWSGALDELLAQSDGLIAEDETNLLATWSQRMMDDRVAGAGLVLKFEKMGVVLENEVEDTGGLPVEKIVSEINENREIRPLVQDIYVGPLRVRERISNWWKRNKGVDSRKIIIDNRGAKRRKWAVFLGVIFLLLLSVSLVSGFIKMNDDKNNKKWVEFSEPIEKKRTEALSLMLINPTGARKLMDEVKNSFDARKSEFVTSKHKNELVDLEKRIGDSWTAASGEKESQLDGVVNIGLLRPGFVGSRLNLIKDNLFLAVDEKMGVLVSLDSKTKDIKVVAGKGEGQQWMDAVGNGSVIMIMNKTGIVEVNKSDYAIRFDSAVNNPVALSFFGKNIYVLDKGNREIYRYGAIDGGFGERTRWLKQGQSMLADPVDMAIDTDIWVAGESGQVEKYRRGTKENFSLNGLPDNTKIVKMSLEIAGNRLAILDNTHGYISICNKDTGNCSQQLKSEKLKQATDIEFDATGTLWILTPGVIGVLK